MSLMRPDTPSDEFPAPGLHFRRRIPIPNTWICISSASGAGFAFPTPFRRRTHHMQRLPGAGQRLSSALPAPDPPYATPDSDAAPEAFPSGTQRRRRFPAPETASAPHTTRPAPGLRWAGAGCVGPALDPAPDRRWIRCLRRRKVHWRALQRWIRNSGAAGAAERAIQRLVAKENTIQRLQRRVRDPSRNENGTRRRIGVSSAYPAPTRRLPWSAV